MLTVAKGMRLKEKGVLRILDVNVNRSCEGLRVLEDVVRFKFDNKDITSKLKKLRHRIRNAFPSLHKLILSERNAKDDVGRFPSADEDAREDLFVVVSRNLRRVEESLRSLEEVSKVFSSSKAHLMKRLRFSLYSIEKDIQALMFPKQGLKKNGIYLVLPDIGSRELLRMVRAVDRTPLSAIQLRSKSLSAKEQISVGKKIRKIAEKNGIPFIVNDRVDIALAVEANGIHIGQDDIPLNVARKLIGSNFIIGVSTNNITEAKEAEKQGADYVAFGSIYETASKKNVIVQGIKKLKQLRRQINIPIVAIGGINDKNIECVSAAGADYAAVISYISRAKHPAAAAKKLYRGFRKGKKPNK